MLTFDTDSETKCHCDPTKRFPSCTSTYTFEFEGGMLMTFLGIILASEHKTFTYTKSLVIYKLKFGEKKKMCEEIKIICTVRALIVVL